MRVTLDGFALPANSGAEWTFLPGTAPHVSRVRVPKRLGEKIFAKAKPDESVLHFRWPEGGGRELKVERLTILGTDSTDDPNYVEVSVTDRRWRWSYPSLYFAANIPRRSGDRRRRASSLPPTAQVLEDDITYAEWSLNPKTGKAWKPYEAIQEIMTRVAGAENTPTGWTNRSKSLQASSQLPPLQDFVIRSQHDAAVGQMLAETGLALSVYVDAGGQVIIYDRLDDAERDLVGAPARGLTTRVDQRKPLIVGGGSWQLQDRRRERPSGYLVYFERLVEARADGRAGTSVSTSSVDPEAPPLDMENVLPSPEDFTFGGVDYAAGEYVSFTTYLNYLIGKQPAGLPRLSDTIIRQGWAHGLLEAYALEELDPSGLWQARIDAVQNHWRLTWRLPKIWVDRIQTIEARLASIQTAETGDRGVSPVFVDYAIHVTWRALGDSVNDRPSVDTVLRNRYANAAARNGGSIIGTPITSLRRAAHCRLSVLEEDLGILRLEFGTADDFSATAKRVQRTAMEPQFAPTDRTWERRIWLQDGFAQSGYEMSTVFSLSLGNPVSTSRFYPIYISNTEAQSALPKLRAAPPPAQGPVKEIIVPASEAMARHEWDDTRSASFYTFFSNVGAPPDALGDPLNRDLLFEVAKAKAAQQAASYADHVEGSATLAFDPKLRPRGTAEAIQVAADERLGAVVRVRLPAEPPGIDANAILPRAVQKVTRRLVDPKN